MSTLISSPVSMNSGTVTTAPVSKVAGLLPPANSRKTSQTLQMDYSPILTLLNPDLLDGEGQLVKGPAGLGCRQPTMRDERKQIGADELPARKSYICGYDHTVGQ